MLDCLSSTGGTGRSYGTRVRLTLLKNRTRCAPERSLDTVVRAVSAAILPVWVDFTSLKGLPCAPGPATTRRGVNILVGVTGKG